jgi:hypothetical protein
MAISMIPLRNAAWGVSVTFGLLAILFPIVVAVHWGYSAGWRDMAEGRADRAKKIAESEPPISDTATTVPPVSSTEITADPNSVRRAS